MRKTLIDIPLKTRDQVIALLNARLADAVDLYIQSKLAHWNVRGPTFIALHELFDKAAAEASEYADTLAERAAQLGGVSGGNIQKTASTTSLAPFDPSLTKEHDVTAALAQAWASFANAARKDIDTTANLGDAVTADILTEIVGETDKMLWFISAHLQ